jgi:ligand-binding sensor domain-containing protein
MNIKNNILFCACALGLIFRAAAQEDINFTSLTTKDGLSSNTVNVILKDKFGLLWFGSDDGLDKFDGTNVKAYRHKPGDSTSLRANEILSLHEDKAGNLWIGTSGGALSLYDRKKDAFINFPWGNNPNTIRHNVVRTVCSDYLGRIWIIHFAGFDVLDPQTRRIIKVPIDSGAAHAIMSGNGISAFEDSKHRMWIGTSEGLLQYDPANRRLKLFQHSSLDPSSLSNGIVNAITEDKQGNIWIGTAGGLSLYKTGSNGFINFRKNGDNLRF